MGVTATVLFLLPSLGSAIWAWAIPVGVWLVYKQSTVSERLVLGSTLLTLGVLSLIGVIWTSATVPAAKQIDYSNLGTWVLFGVSVVSGLAGLGLIISTRR